MKLSDPIALSSHSVWMASLIGIGLLCAWLKLFRSLLALFYLSAPAFALQYLLQPLKEGGDRGEEVTEEVFIGDQIGSIFNGKENRLYCRVIPIFPFFPHRVSLCFAMLENSLYLAALVFQHRQAAACLPRWGLPRIHAQAHGEHLFEEIWAVWRYFCYKRLQADCAETSWGKILQRMYFRYCWQ